MNVQIVPVSVSPTRHPSANAEPVSRDTSRAEPPPATGSQSGLAAPQKTPPSAITPNYRLDGEPSDPDVIPGSGFDEFV